jgi:hypothetical protein
MAKLRDTWGMRVCAKKATPVAKAMARPAAAANSASSQLRRPAERWTLRKRMFMQNFFNRPIRCVYSSLSPVGLMMERSWCSLR